MAITGTNIGVLIPASVATGASFLAFRNLGGAEAVNGLCFLSLATCTLFFPIFLKIGLGLPFQACAKAPENAMFMIALGCSAVACSSILVKGVRLPADIIKIGVTNDELSKMSNFCIFVFVLVLLLEIIFPTVSELAYWQGFRGVVAMLPVSATAFELIKTVRTTNGKYTFSAKSLLYIFLGLIPAFYGFWRQGMFAPIILYTAIRIGSKRLPAVREMIAVTMVVSALVYFVFPLTTLGHSFIQDRYSGGMLAAIRSFAIDAASGALDSELLMVSQSIAQSDSPVGTFFCKPMGVSDRFSRFSEIDALAAASVSLELLGWRKYIGRVTFLPKSLTGVSAEFGSGNELARAIGALGEQDYITGISFGMFADAVVYLGNLQAFAALIVLNWIFFAVNNLLAKRAESSSAHILLAMSAHPYSEASGAFVIYHATRTLPFLLVLFWLLKRIGKVTIDGRRHESVSN